MDGYVKVAEYVGAHGARYEVLDRDALLQQEPSLTEVAEQLTGAVYFPDDAAANARQFCEQLVAVADYCLCGELSAQPGDTFSCLDWLRHTSG